MEELTQVVAAPGNTVTDTSALKEVIDLVFDAAEGVAVLTDGFQLKDLIAEGKIVRDLPAVLRDASKVLPQYVQLDSVAQDELVAYVETKTVLDSQTASAILVKVFEIAIQLKDLVTGLLGFAGVVKKKPESKEHNA